MSFMDYDILEEVEKYKHNYQTQTKSSISMMSVLFKSSHKLNCATKVTETFDIMKLIQKTIYIIPSTNKIFVDYLVYKLYANPSVYHSIVDYTISLFSQCISLYGNFECHIHLKSFTITSAHRYREMIELFCNKCLSIQNPNYSTMLSAMYIYNSPSMMEMISNTFSYLINPNVKNKITIFNKSDSEIKLKELFSIHTIVSSVSTIYNEGEQELQELYN